MPQPLGVQHSCHFDCQVEQLSQRIDVSIAALRLLSWRQHGKAEVAYMQGALHECRKYDHTKTILQQFLCCGA